jgi:hypothetical protein
MGNVLQRCERIPKDIKTSLFFYWFGTVEKIVYIFLQDLSKRNHYLYYTGVLQIFHTKTDEISRTLPKENSGTTLAAPRRSLV